MENDESAYIGKAMYKRNQYSKENIILTDNQAASFSSFISKLDPVELQKNEALCALLSDVAGIDFKKREQELAECKKGAVIKNYLNLNT